MPRWLIAVFTLHFLLSVGVSAFGKVPPVEHLRPAVASVQLAPAGEAAMAAAAASMSSTQTNGVERASLYNMEGAPERTSATPATTSTAPMAGYTKGLYQSTEDE